MPTEYDIIFEEFSGELDALAEMSRGPAQPAGAFSAKARIAAGNGATLLLAAIFEEFVRQTLRTAYREKASKAQSMAAFPNKIVQTVWRRALDALARRPFDDIAANVASTDAHLANVVAFCLRKEVRQEIAEVLAHNETNMRPKMMNELFNTIGVPDFTGSVCEDADLIAFLGCDSAGKAASECAAKLDDFFRRRNDIAHAVQLGTSSGPTELTYDIDLFRAFGKAITASIPARV